MRRSLNSVVVIAALLVVTPSLAVAGSQALIDLKHNGWTLENGAPPGIQALAQSAEGYLLLGSWRGLFRFDGVTFEGVTPPADGVPRSDEVSALETLSNGDTWVGYRSGDLAVYRNGRLLPLAIPRHAGSVHQIEEDHHDAGVWVLRWHKQGEILHYNKDAWTELDASWGLPERFIFRMLCAHDGTLWVTVENALYYLPKGSRRFILSPETVTDGADIEEDRHGRIWLSDAKGVRMLPLDRASSTREIPGPSFPPGVAASVSFRLLLDRNDNIWGTAETGGLVRIRRPVEGASSPDRLFEIYRAANGLTSDIAGPLIEDREGNVWVATTTGIDRFRAARAVLERGIPPGQPFAYLLRAARDGAVFVADSDSFYRIPAGGSPHRILRRVNPSFLCEGRGGEMWLGTFRGLHRYQDGKLSFESIPFPYESHGVLDCAVDYQGNLWIVDGDAGLLRRTPRGDWSRYPPSDPEHENYAAILPDSRGRILLGYRESLIKRIDFPDFSTLWADSNASPGRLQSLERDGEDLYVVGQNGIARIRGSSTALLSRTEHPELQGVTGIARSQGEVWLMSAVGVLHIASSELAHAFDEPAGPLHFAVIAMNDGLPGTAALGQSYQAVAGGDGRLWFVTREGLARIDPSDINLNRLPPPVVIESIQANGARAADLNSLTLGAGVNSLEIDYTALSFNAPDRVRFQYRLEGVDPGWVDAGARRQAFYTNLDPGSYRFHVIAANEDGVWNNTGAVLGFQIPPTFFQSLPFKVASALAALGLLWLLYSLRVRAIADRLHMAATARLKERERIARELHDTLLQGFQGLMLRLQAGANRVRSEPEQAHRMLEQALERADEVLEEGRDRVRDLRSTERDPIDLPQTFIRAAEEPSPSSAQVHVAVEGAPRELHPLVREEIEKIGTEAITNARRHAKAARIEVDLVFERRRFLLRVRDDGIGIDAAIAHTGRTGHFGLTGMRERARQIRGAIAIASRPNVGTEIELIVPAALAYVPLRARTARLWLRRLRRALEFGIRPV